MKNYTWYKLVGTKPMIDETQGGWFKTNRSLTRLSHTPINKDIMVTTIFTCLSSNEEKPPLVFETSVIGRGAPEAVRKFATYEDAINGHKKLVEEMKIIFGI